jgi:hypothetical protein
LVPESALFGQINQEERMDEGAAYLRGWPVHLFIEGEFVKKPMTNISFFYFAFGRYREEMLVSTKGQVR